MVLKEEKYPIFGTVISLTAIEQNGGTAPSTFCVILDRNGIEHNYIEYDEFDEANFIYERLYNALNQLQSFRNMCTDGGA